MNDASLEEPEDHFAYFAERIAAQARQLFRAACAEDAKAVEVTLFYLRDFLVKVLARPPVALWRPMAGRFGRR
jgi:hypothetical protein